MNSALSPYFGKVRGKIIPGAHRLQLLLTKWMDKGILNIPCLLVGGSNGKGTVCAYLESILRQHNIYTGLYTSPHLIHPNERIRLNGVPIQEERLNKYLNEILDEVPRRLSDASFFEITTATAFLAFLEEEVEILVCEVGLGGHFDSTNAISPIISILTSVSLEHTEYLGNTEAKIAFDKSHISRRNSPFIVGQLSEQAFRGVIEAATKIGSHVFQSEKFYPNNQNLNTALTAIKHLEKVYSFQFDQEKITNGILKMFWPGRFDVRTHNSRTVIFDAAHNPDGFQFFLNQYFSSNFSNRKCVLLFACLNDKDWHSLLKKFTLIAEYVILTQIQSSRTESIENFITAINTIKEQNNIFPQFEAIPDTNRAIERAFSLHKSLPLVVTGSIAFIGDVMETLKLEVFPN